MSDERPCSQDDWSEDTRAFAETLTNLHPWQLQKLSRLADLLKWASVEAGERAGEMGDEGRGVDEIIRFLERKRFTIIT